MQSIKSFTDIEQSKKLAEILPIESADMYYMETSCNNYTIGVLRRMERDMLIKQAEYYKMLPCWSLAALLGVFSYYEINNNGVNIQLSVKGESLLTEEGECLLDLVVNMIIHLHELKML